MGRLLLALKAVGGATAVVGVAAVVDASTQLQSDGHTLKTAANQYLLHRAMTGMGFIARWRLDSDAARADEVQEEFLRGILDENKGTEYGARFGFGEMIGTAARGASGTGEEVSESFRSCHPLTTYPHYKQYIDRMAQSGAGPEERSLLTAEPVSRLGVTSGTSGQPSMLPVVPAQRSIFFIQGITVVFDTISQCFPSFQSSMQRTLKLFFAPPTRTMPSGLPYGPNSSAPADNKSLLQLYTTPPAAYDSRVSETDSLYLYALFALGDRNLGCIESNFVSAVLNFFDNLEGRYSSLVSDIAAGSITREGLTIPEEVRQALQASLKPDPARAQQLLDARDQAATVGLAKAIWPNLHMVLAVSTGTFDLYGEQLRQRFLGPSDVPIYSPLYAATEGLIGVNIDGPPTPPKAGVATSTNSAEPRQRRQQPQQRYMLVPRAMYLEFIPVEDSGSDQPDTLTMADGGPGGKLKEGSEYELVVTTKCGLYRYRMGDVVKVVSFHGKAPVVEVRYRQGQLLNVRGEKMPEHTLYRCLSDAVDDWSSSSSSGSNSGSNSSNSGSSGGVLADYTTVDTFRDPLVQQQKQQKQQKSAAARSPAYIVYVESKSVPSGESVSESNRKLSALLDEQLQQSHHVFRSFRAKNAIGEPQVRLVRPGSFKEMRGSLVEQGMSPNQLKMPRVLRSDRLAALLQEHVLPPTASA